ncbi:hypothetical protein PF010_g12602 [Phytophthora fragariae]|uniref:Uncharacterized protein n=1 Tax=Phytophthora fragariae TaxID=53985 RepID=A0A6G0L3B5_9STRA|nr:hypothetical protein PF010_g12602 [Phytophthora fragariae]
MPVAQVLLRDGIISEREPLLYRILHMREPLLDRVQHRREPLLYRVLHVREPLLDRVSLQALARSRGRVADGTNDGGRALRTARASLVVGAGTWMSDPRLRRAATGRRACG